MPIAFICGLLAGLANVGAAYVFFAAALLTALKLAEFSHKLSIRGGVNLIHMAQRRLLWVVFRPLLHFCFAAIGGYCLGIVSSNMI